jgi:HAE1 family hydrophobic/amphiphilic exporter-1
MKFEQIPSFAIRRNVTVLMSLIAILVLGFITLNLIKLEFMPKGLTAPFMGIWVPYTNSTPEEVEKLIAEKVEPAINTVPNKKRQTSNILPHGMWVFMEFNEDANIDQSYLDLIDRMERLKPELPEEVRNYRVRRFRPGSNSEFDIFVISEKENDDVFNFVKNFVAKRFERIDGVAQVDFDASGEKNIYIYINTDLVNAYNVNLADVIAKLRNDNFSMSSGYVHEGEHKIFVRSRAKIYTLDQLKNITVNDRGLKLGDIATIDYTTGERERAWRINGKDGMDLEIAKEPLANTIEVTDRIAQEIKDLNEHPRMKEMGVRLEPIFNQGKYIKQSVFNLIESGLWGGLFAFIFIYLFLKRFRMTIIITLAIPISILISILCLYFLDLTLNGFTLMGLLIAVGLVVDNAIVIVENIYRKRQEGHTIVDAAIKGTAEVGLAITLSTLTTVAIFMPILLLPQNGMGGFFKAIAIPVVAALLASLVVAVVYIPYTATRISSNKSVDEPLWVQRLATRLTKITMFFVRRRVDAFMTLFIILLFLGMKPFPAMVGSNDGNINDFRIMLDLPDNYTFEQTNNLLKVMENEAKTKKDEYQIKAYSAFARKNFAQIKIFLEDKEIPPWYTSVYRNIRSGLETVGLPPLKLPITREQAEEDFKKLVPDMPGITIRTSWSDQGAMKSDPSVTLQLEGDETQKLLSIAREMERRLKTIPQVKGTDINLENGQDEVTVKIDRLRIQNYNLDINTVQSIINFNIRGVSFNNFQKANGEEIRVFVQSRREDRERLEQLKSLILYTRDGQQVPLSAVANFSITKGLGNIRHENGKTILQLKALAHNEDEVPIVKENLANVLAGLDMPFGYKWGLGRVAQQQEEQKADAINNMLMGLILIILLMGVLFESFILPFSVIISIPLAFVGSKFLLLATNTGIDIMALIGLIVLVGIVVNNGIVLIDAINRNRQRGMSRNDAIEDATRHRVRPILLTAITTVAGLLPMALGETEFIGIKYAPMGRVVLGGLVSSTMLTLIFTPVIYTFFDDLRELFMNMLKTALLNKSSSSSGAAPELQDRLRD